MRLPKSDSGAQQYILDAKTGTICYATDENGDGVYEIGQPVINPNASYGFYNIYAAFNETGKLNWLDNTDKKKYLGYDN